MCVVHRAILLYGPESRVLIQHVFHSCIGVQYEYEVPYHVFADIRTARANYLPEAKTRHDKKR